MSVDNEPVAADTVAQTPDAAPSGAGTPPDPSPGPADTAAGDPPPEPKPHRDRRAEKRIASLTRKNEELLTRLGRLEGQMAAAMGGTRPATDDQPPARPQPNQFNSAEEYQDALIAWNVEQRLARLVGEAQRQSKAQAENSKATQRTSAVVDRLQESGAEIEDFEEVMETITAPDFPISVAMRDYLEDSEQRAHVALYLAEHRKDAERIYGLSSVAAIRELDKIAAKAPRPAPPSRPNATDAPPPPPRLDGRTVAQADPAKMSMDDYARMWKERHGIKH